MIANYHTHTFRCHHASGTTREYIETAIQNGLQILGFSDHVPYPFHNGYTSRIRMSVGETEDYVKELMALREEYRDRIQIHIGYEAEFYPDDFQAMLDHIRQYGCDYLILGQHSIGNEWEGVYSGSKTQDGSRLTAYVDQVVEALETGVFSCVAHPDLLYYCGDEQLYLQQMRRLCQAAKALQIPLEMNLLGMVQHRNYPCQAFWRIVAETGNRVILGCDAHCPEHVANPKIEKRGRQFLEKFGLAPMETLEFRSINGTSTAE